MISVNGAREKEIVLLNHYKGGKNHRSYHLVFMHPQETFFTKQFVDVTN